MITICNNPKKEGGGIVAVSQVLVDEGPVKSNYINNNI
jgi:hypothetical protein